MYLVQPDKSSPLVLSNTAARLEPPDFDPTSGENLDCHGALWAGEEVSNERGSLVQMASGT